MSVTWMEMSSGLVQHEMPFGWAYSYAMIAFERSFPDFQYRNRSQYANAKADVNDFGDPGLQTWVGVPRIVEAEIPETISLEPSMVEVYVFDPDLEEDAQVGGAQVTFYAPGDLPDFDDDDYDDYDDMQMWTTTTDTNGIARFVFEDGVEFEQRTDVFVTVTGRSIVPYFGEMEVETPDRAIELADYQLNDDEVNPGDELALSLNAVNIGDEEVTEVRAVISSLSPYVEIDEENDEITFGDIEGGNTSEGEGEIVLQISPVCPDGESRPITKPTILIDFHSGENHWRSAIRLNPVAPNFKVRSVVGGTIISTDEDEYELDVNIENIGGMDAPAMTARIEPLGIGIATIREEALYPAIDAGRNSRIDGNEFLIAANRIVVPGSTTEMIMILRSEAGFVDTAYFDLQVDEPRENAPLGPDGYGYICFDDTDDDWDMAPEYDWFEISPDDRNYDEEGTACDFDGNSPSDVGESQVVTLGFTTQFYGQEYTHITICTNGFIAMGDQERITNFQNWPMDQAIGGGAGMIAPLWDWLRFSGDAQVYYYYDETDNRFIVEWYQLRHRNGGDTDLTFQVILYDKNVWVTETGDPNIVIQYKSIANVQGLNTADLASPYASVGISSPDGTTGINYSFRNQYPITAARLENQRALLFATSPKYRAGIIEGYVTNARTGEPIFEASVVTEHGLAARTDEEGFYRINNALAEVPFDITARAVGYNDSTLTDTLEENDTLEINFALLHPEFGPSQREFQAMLDPDLEEEIQFSLANDGDGPLDWTLRKRLPNDADVEEWEHRESFFVGEPVEDTRIKGVVYTDNQFFCTGGGNDINYIYIFDREGEPIDQLEQFTDSRYGMSDLAWDGSLLWGSDGQTIYGFTTEGELQVTFEGPFNPTTALAWDPDRQILWLSGRTTQHIAGYNRDGREVMRAPRNGFRVNGLAYWLDDPDGYPLYIFHKVGASQQTVHKMNPDNGDTMFVS
ncbi:MAG: carboxypeptidase regulatory-like domain-containing protein, partial [Candidatus Electryoneaceae bacterium]|nr:carboxypeptidase regulatory-like domain-containing protein [Candidatus Electryoneaceae bacterium]